MLVLPYEILPITKNIISYKYCFYNIKTATLRSRLPLTKSGCLFAFIPLQTMSLSSRNRSNSKAFRHILPCVAPFCEGMHYHKTGVPWHTNNTLIIDLFLLILPGNALFCKGFWDSCSLL